VGLFKNSFGKSLGDNSYISINEALAFCNENKYKITKQGLIYIGKKEGWVIKTQKNHIIIDKEHLLIHILDSRERVPWGFIAVSSMSKLAKNESEYYRVLNNSNIEFRIYGREKKRYARKEDIKKIFREHRKSNLKPKKEKDKPK
jgi:hypothetical protein